MSIWSRSDLTEFNIELVRETEMAVLVRSELTDQEAWVPKSLCEVDDDEVMGLRLIIPEKIAIEKGLV